MRRGSIRTAVYAGVATFILGPVIGAFLFFIAIAVAALHDAASIAEGLWQLLSLPALAVLITPFAFMMAGPASFAAGLWVGASVFLRNRLGYLEAAAIAFVSTIVVMPTWFYLLSRDGNQTLEAYLEQNGGAAFMFAALSVIVAIVLRWVLGSWGLLRPLELPDEKRG